MKKITFICIFLAFIVSVIFSFLFVYSLVSGQELIDDVFIAIATSTPEIIPSLIDPVETLKKNNDNLKENKKLRDYIIMYSGDDPLFEYFNTDDNDYGDTAGAVWLAQTFTTISAHTIASIKTKIYKEANPPSILYIYIRNNTCTGDNLTTGTLDISGITTTPSWYEVSLTEISLLDATTYCIVYNTKDDSNKTRFRNHYTTNPAEDLYLGGINYRSTDSGSSWNYLANQYGDILFEVWGNEEEPPPPPPPTGTTTAITICQTIGSIMNCTTTQPFILGTFTYGESLILFFLFVIILAKTFHFIIKHFLI